MGQSITEDTTLLTAGAIKGSSAAEIINKYLCVEVGGKECCVRSTHTFKEAFRLVGKGEVELEEFLRELNEL
ncbi:MAG: hypothetical protein WC238_01555 [Parcubacteria group bacterium]|jgi:hypothetical protein